MDCIDERAVPEGWSVEQHSGFPHVVVLSRPAGGCVSINMKKRIFGPGYGCPHVAMGGAPTYEGRAWKARIVTDAVAWLDRQMA
ncbi:TPA: hypothetical protein ACK3Q6_004079 [Burkholderia cepacia]|jgi:hypothetical protein|uniref:Uncharacterized protein n=2 Tax=Burkholderia cepacia complex TaxID=87882 RepID=A0A250LKN0_9BURK|nr:MULTISPECIES: hypothetical protein [Burkholderia]MBA9831093.1 hypothetical protein [Burkholderia contaminans]MBA9906733.1 hypothetical protein [Burkholderia contaminans]MBX3822825.1 hypothetical protein [Burkholderia contaminans]MBX3843184.1 hypothetical protein [Burkholderia contaminans]MBX3861087.1 hypothetical protein [Burkholderia contaminans]